jgi:phosphoribosylformimino-5-aminoimidazole carboxamide ribotide isomerase
MIVYPAIDIRSGQCVRLLRGEYDKQTVYGDDPVAMAKRFMDCGATHLHIVDLDGARSGLGENLRAIEAIAGLGVKVQTGGGIRTRQDVEKRMACGVFRCVLGTAAVENPELVRWAVDEFGAGAIAVGIDAKDGVAAVRGWEQKSTMTPSALGLRMKQAGVRTLVFTQIERDGMRTGPDIAASLALAIETGLEVIVSGGVAGIGDVEAVARSGLGGVIIGKAIYEGSVDLAQAAKYQTKF